MIHNTYKSIDTFFKYYTSFSSVIESICQPLFQISGLTHFAYVKVYNDGKILRFSNLDYWTEKYFDNEIFNDKSFYLNKLKTVPLYGERRFLWTGTPSEKTYSLMHENNIWNGLSIYQRYQGFVESFHFASTRDNTGILEFYIQDNNVLYEFMVHFKEKFSSFIEEAEKNNFKITTALSDTDIVLPEKEQAFFIKKYPLYDGRRNVYLSKREFECILYLSHGKSAKEVANLLDLSSRTVTSYLDNIKAKFGNIRTSDLISLYFRNPNYYALEKTLFANYQDRTRIGSHEKTNA